MVIMLLLYAEMDHQAFNAPGTAMSDILLSTPASALAMTQDALFDDVLGLSQRKRLSCVEQRAHHSDVLSGRSSIALLGLTFGGYIGPYRNVFDIGQSVVVADAVSVSELYIIFVRVDTSSGTQNVNNLDFLPRE